jgi:hypothetical protein
MKKTPEQKELIRDNKMIPLFWHVACDSKNHLLVVNTFTGEYRVLDK